MLVWFSNDMLILSGLPFQMEVVHSNTTLNIYPVTGIRREEGHLLGYSEWWWYWFFICKLWYLYAFIQCDAVCM